MVDDVLTFPFGKLTGLDLHPLYERLRAEGPLARVTMPYGGQAWLAVRYDAIKQVFSDPRFSRAATRGQDIPRMTPMVQQDMSILSMDPPDHNRLRKLVGRAFTAGRVESARSRIQHIVGRLVDELIDNGQPGELMESLAWPLPITVICELLGVPVADQVHFRAWTDQILAISGDGESVGRAHSELAEYLRKLIAERRNQPADDLLSQLVPATEDGDRLTEDELITFGVTVLVAGHETTANQIGNFMYLLLSRRHLWSRLVEAPELVPRAVEELLRFVPLTTASGFPRIALEDVEVSGQLVRAGETVQIQVSSANRDEELFDRSAEIDFDRPKVPHLAFGHGPHYCLGAQLSRVQLHTVFDTMVRRLPDLRLDCPADDVEWRLDRLVRGVRALPLVW